MKRFVLLLFVAGCPATSDIAIYRSLSQPGAMQTCDANQRYRAEVKGADPAEAKAKGEAKIRTTIASAKGCGAFVFNEGSGKALDGKIWAADLPNT